METHPYYNMLSGPQTLDYEIYLSTQKLLSCQKSIDDLVNADELQFQIVHQVEELWMKLLVHTLLQSDAYMAQKNTHRVVSLYRRAHMLLRLMSQQLEVLETMSPREYQEIRLQLGNGSGQESPGFRTLMRLIPNLWEQFDAQYLTGAGRSIKNIYDDGYTHDDAYIIAECLMELDELMGKFRANHIFLIHRSIGIAARSLKGRPVEMLDQGAKHRFFPKLWDVRSEMTDAWGGTYGTIRDNLMPDSV